MNAPPRTTGGAWRLAAAVGALALVWLFSCASARSRGGSTASSPPPVPVPAAVAGRIRLQIIADKLDEPLGMAFAPGDPGKRLFIVEKGGRIRILRDGRILPAPFLDLHERVSGRSEQGLLGLAFHAEFLKNGRLYVNYTDKRGDTRIVEITVAAPGEDRGVIASERELLEVTQPYANHNGGHLLTMPGGWLLVGLGDGGSGGDPHGNARNPNTLLGKMFRLDPGAPAAGRTTILAQGARNPWRYAVDRETNVLYIGDVGQNAWEEVDVVPLDSLKGRDFGWNVMEGTHCYKAATCRTDGLTLPVVEFGHDAGCSITGGVVYRGKALPQLSGSYFYSDYCTAFLRSFRWTATGGVTDHWDWSKALQPRIPLSQIASFGEDESGEVYVIGLAGTIWKLAPQVP